MVSVTRIVVFSALCTCVDVKKVCHTRINSVGCRFLLRANALDRGCCNAVKRKLIIFL
jgi:hypothetical protein